jgi:hypothetical protein
MYFNLNQYQQSFDRDAFDKLILSQGVRVVHFRAVPDPSGRANLGDTHGVQSPRESSDNFIYKEAGTAQVFFSQNHGDFNVHVEGLTKNDFAVITPPDSYEAKGETQGGPLMLAPYDRLYLKDVEVRIVNYQFVQANSTGLDRLQYPATCVEYLIDADGIEYREHVDFEITKEGNIKWLTQNRPAWNPELEAGKVYAIRYRYTPYFVVARHLNEIRVSQITDPATFDRRVERMPYHVLLIREHVLHDVNRDPHKANVMDNRLQYAPSVSGFLGPQ